MDPARKSSASLPVSSLQPPGPASISSSSRASIRNPQSPIINLPDSKAASHPPHPIARRRRPVRHLCAPRDTSRPSSPLNRRTSPLPETSGQHGSRTPGSLCRRRRPHLDGAGWHEAIDRFDT